MSILARFPSRATSPVRLNIFDGTNHKPALQEDHSFSEAAGLIAELAKRVVQTKKQSAAITFGRLSKPYNNDANTEVVTALAIDVDKVPDLDGLLARLDRGRCEALVYETASSTDELPRLRIMAPLDRPLAPSEVKHARRSFAELLGIGPGQGVETAEAISNFYFVGRLEGTRPRKVWRFRGDALPADGLAAAKLRHSWKQIKAAVKCDVDVADLPPAPEACVTDYAEFLATADTERSNARYTYALEGAWRGLNAEQIRAGLEDHYLPRHDVEADDAWFEKHVPRALRSIHGDPIKRGEARAFAGLLAWEARREKREAKRRREAFIARMRGLRSEVQAANDTEPVTPESDSAALFKEWTRTLVQLKAEAAAPQIPIEKRVYDPTGPDPLSKFGRRADLSVEPKPPRYLCRKLGIAKSGRVTLIRAQPSGGKSPIMMQLAVALAGQKPFLGEPVDYGPVLYLDHEGGAHGELRLAKIARAMGVDLATAPIELWDVAGRNSDDEFLVDLCQKMLRMRDQYGAMPVVIQDTLTAANGGDLEQNSAEYSEPLRALGKLANLLGTAVIVLIHDNRAGKFSGHNSIKAACQTMIALTQQVDNSPHITISCDRAPEGSFEKLKVTITDVPDPGAGTTGHSVLGAKWGLLTVLDDSPAAADSSVAPKLTPQLQKALAKRQAVQQTMVRAVECVAEASGGSARYVELKREAGDVSGRVLSEALQRLKKASVLSQTSPSSGYYQLTDTWRGKTPEWRERQVSLLASKEVPSE